jgi:hypothetical protein
VSLGWTARLGPAESGWADLRQFDGGTGFGAPGGVGSGAGAVAAWPAVAPVGSYELLMMVIRGSQAVSDGVSGSADNPDPLDEQAAGIFAGQLARIAFLRSARSAQLRVGQRRARRPRDYLAAGAASRAESPAATATCREGCQASGRGSRGDCSA